MPHINFESADESRHGFEIVSLEKIANKKEALDHNPEIAHQLKFYMLLYITEGTGQHFIDFDWYNIEVNDLIYLSKDQVNAFKFSKELKGYCFVFTEEFLINCFKHLPKNFILRLFDTQLKSPIVKITSKSRFINYFDLILEEFNDKTGINASKTIESLFSIMLSKAENIRQNSLNKTNESSKILLFQDFTQLLEINFSKSRNAKFYAKQLAITYKHLNVVCNELVHKTAKTVITDYIILQAKRKLINSEIKSTELAYQLGFEDPTNFTKFFKKETGLTPNSFKIEHI